MGYKLQRGKVTFTVCSNPSALATFEKCPTCDGPVSKALVVATAVDDDPECFKADTAIWCVACFGSIFQLWLDAADELAIALEISERRARAFAKTRLELVK